LLFLETLEHTIHKNCGYETISRECKITISGAPDWNGGREIRRKRKMSNETRKKKKAKRIENDTEPEEADGETSDTEINSNVESEF